MISIAQLLVSFEATTFLWEIAMEPSSTKYQSMLRWVDASTQSQASWIASYLYSKGQGHLLAHINPQSINPHELLLVLTPLLQSSDYREKIRAMRGAWYQKRHRDEKGKLANFQLSQKTSSQLEKIAKEWGLTKTKALEQIIVDAANKNQEDKTKAAGRAKKLKQQLEQITQEKADSESVRNKIINDAIELLMQEAALNCRLIATLDGVKESELLKLTEEPVQKLLSSRTQEIDDKLCDLKLLRSGIKRVQDHLPKND